MGSCNVKGAVRAMRPRSFVKNNMLVIAACAFALALVVAAVLWVATPWQPKAVEEDVGVRQGLGDYSWDELSAISVKIGACETEDDAVRIAARYGLCSDSGSIDPDDTKTFSLANGRQIRVRLAGLWHDIRSDGGKAGLTFAFADSAGEYAMNHAFENADGDDADSVGGWRASDMRAWLNGDFLNELPADLRSRISSVQKRTANLVGIRDELDEAGRLAGTAQDWMSETSDKLWLFSVAELCGSISARAELGVDSTMVPVYAAEGAQYRLFADAGVAPFAPNDALVRFGEDAVIVDDELGERDDDPDAPVATGSNSVVPAPCTWWLRTKTLEFGNGFWLVGTDGAPLNGLGEDARAVDPAYAPDAVWGPDHARGVVVGFCL